MHLLNSQNGLYPISTFVDLSTYFLHHSTIHKVPDTQPPTNLPAPLAEVMRPSSIESYVGQESVIGRNAILRSILETGQVPSLIFWGPPGCGKVRCLVYKLQIIYNWVLIASNCKGSRSMLLGLCWTLGCCVVYSLARSPLWRKGKEECGMEYGTE